MHQRAARRVLERPRGTSREWPDGVPTSQRPRHQTLLDDHGIRRQSRRASRDGGSPADWVRGYEARDPNLPYISAKPIYEPLPSDQRFQDLLRRSYDSQPVSALFPRLRLIPGAAFTGEVLASLLALKKEDQAAFEELRAQLKSAGRRVTALDKAMAEADEESGGRQPTQADILIRLFPSVHVQSVLEERPFHALAEQGRAGAGGVAPRPRPGVAPPG